MCHPGLESLDPTTASDVDLVGGEAAAAVVEAAFDAMAGLSTDAADAASKRVADAYPGGAKALRQAILKRHMQVFKDAEKVTSRDAGEGHPEEGDSRSLSLDAERYLASYLRLAAVVGVESQDSEKLLTKILFTAFAPKVWAASVAADAPPTLSVGAAFSREATARGAARAARSTQDGRGAARAKADESLGRSAGDRSGLSAFARRMVATSSLGTQRQETQQEDAEDAFGGAASASASPRASPPSIEGATIEAAEASLWADDDAGDADDGGDSDDDDVGAPFERPGDDLASIDLNPVNRHPAMAPLVRGVLKLCDKAAEARASAPCVEDAPRDRETPPFVAVLVERLDSRGTSRAARVFAIQLVVNCRVELEPYGAVLRPPLARAACEALAGDQGVQGVDHVLRAAVTVLVAWAPLGEAVPREPLGRVATALVDLRVSGPHPNFGVFHCHLPTRRVVRARSRTSRNKQSPYETVEGRRPTRVPPGTPRETPDTLELC